MVLGTCVEIEAQVGGLCPLQWPSMWACSVSRVMKAWPPCLLIPVRLGQVLASPKHLQEVTFKLSEGCLA